MVVKVKLKGVLEISNNCVTRTFPIGDLDKAFKAAFGKYIEDLILLKKFRNYFSNDRFKTKPQATTISWHLLKALIPERFTGTRRRKILRSDIVNTLLIKGNDEDLLDEIDYKLNKGVKNEKIQ